MVGMDFDLPSYSHSLRPTFLCLDGGGTRVVTQLYLLCEIMHRLAWDLKLISPKPTKAPRPQISPADWFDYIGGGGTGSIVAYLLACGYSAEEARDKFVELSSTIVHDRSELGIKLEALLPRHENMWWDGDCIADLPARSNIWIASPENPERPHESQGKLIAAGTPITKFLLPLVLAEVEREITGKTDTLNYTLPFVQSVCPIFNECSILLSLGSGDVPNPKSNTSPPPSPLSSYNPLSWLTGATSPTTPTTPTLPALPSSRATLSSIRALNEYIPTSAHGNSYIRLNPSLITWSTSGVQSWPSDWGCEKFGEHKMLISGFCSRYENGASMDCVVDVLKRRGLAVSSRRIEKERIRDEKTEVKESMQKLLFASAGWY